MRFDTQEQFKKRLHRNVAWCSSQLASHWNQTMEGRTRQRRIDYKKYHEMAFNNQLQIERTVLRYIYGAKKSCTHTAFELPNTVPTFDLVSGRELDEQVPTEFHREQLKHVRAKVHRFVLASESCCPPSESTIAKRRKRVGIVMRQLITNWNIMRDGSRIFGAMVDRESVRNIFYRRSVKNPPVFMLTATPNASTTVTGYLNRTGRAIFMDSTGWGSDFADEEFRSIPKRINTVINYYKNLGSTNQTHFNWLKRLFSTRNRAFIEYDNTYEAVKRMSNGRDCTGLNATSVPYPYNVIGRVNGQNQSGEWLGYYDIPCEREYEVAGQIESFVTSNFYRSGGE